MNLSRSAVTLVSAALLAPFALGAQEPSDTVMLSPVVVTATRVPRPKADVPAAMSVFTAADLEARGIHLVADALRDIPGAAVVQQGSFGGVTSLFVRGGQSNYVKVLVDGVPVNQPGGAFDFASLTTDNVERIEVLRGPASVLYGSDAVTGVVQIFTRRGRAPEQAELAVRGGTYGAMDWSAALAGGAARAGYSIGASRDASDGVYAFNNEYHNTVASGLVHLAPDARTDATLSVRYGDNVYHFPTDGAGVPSDHNQFTASKGPTIGLDVGRHFTRRVETRLLLSTNASDGGYDDQPDSAADDNLYHSRDRFRRTSADARTNLELPGHWILTVGGALEQEHGRSSNICTFAGFSCATPPIDTVRWDRAVYTQVVGGLGPRGSIVAGARVDDNQRFGRYATYRAGVSVRLGGGLSLRASGGNAFREPTFFENFSTGFAVGNPNLRPEHSRSLEAGVDQAIARGTVTLSATLFDQRFVDMIDYNPSAAPGAPNYANVAGATANGAEVGVRVSAARALAVGVSYTYLHTAVTSAGFDSTSGAALAAGRPLLRRPAHSARLDADYRVGSRGSVGLVVTYVGERQDQGFSTFPFPRVPLPAYARVDCAAALDVVHRRAAAPALAVTLRIDNLLDHAYEEVKNFPARGRTILVGARARLGY